MPYILCIDISSTILLLKRDVHRCMIVWSRARPGADSASNGSSWLSQAQRDSNGNIFVFAGMNAWIAERCVEHSPINCPEHVRGAHDAEPRLEADSDPRVLTTAHMHQLHAR